MSPLHLSSLACLVHDLYGDNGSILLSVVAQDLLLYISVVCK
jgi:hypothetical protein